MSAAVPALTSCFAPSTSSASGAGAIFAASNTVTPAMFVQQPPAAVVPVAPTAAGALAATSVTGAPEFSPAAGVGASTPDLARSFALISHASLAPAVSVAVAAASPGLAASALGAAAPVPVAVEAQRSAEKKKERFLRFVLDVLESIGGDHFFNDLVELLAGFGVQSLQGLVQLGPRGALESFGKSIESTIASRNVLFQAAYKGLVVRAMSVCEVEFHVQQCVETFAEALALPQSQLWADNNVDVVREFNTGEERQVKARCPLCTTWITVSKRPTGKPDTSNYQRHLKEAHSSEGIASTPTTNRKRRVPWSSKEGGQRSRARGDGHTATSSSSTTPETSPEAAATSGHPVSPALLPMQSSVRVDVSSSFR
jgi:hypothetical protein